MLNWFNKLSQGRKIAFVLFALIFIMLFYTFVIGFTRFGIHYFPDFESALNAVFDTDNTGSIEIITIIQGEDYPVALFKDLDNNNLLMINFMSRKRNGQTVYRAPFFNFEFVSLEPFTTGDVAVVEVFHNTRRSRMWLTSAQRYSAEKVAFGFFPEWGEYYSEITGIDTNFVSFYMNGEEHTMWYIVGREELAAIPEFRTVRPAEL